MNLFDNNLETVVEVLDFGDHSRVCWPDGRIVKKFDGFRHKPRAEEYAAAFTAGWLAREERDQ